MNATELAAKLNGREYGDEITKEEEQDAKRHDLVVVFGYSDDNMELRGALHDEVGAGDDTTFRIGILGILPEWDRYEEKTQDAAREWFKQEAVSYNTIRARFDAEGYSWIYETAIPHATFDVMEDGQKFCRGIVFHRHSLVAE